MLYLVFRLGDDRYALAAGLIKEVVPLVALKNLPAAPAGVAGLIDYHGVAVPLIDLAAMALGRPSIKRMSTRIAIVDYRAGAENHMLGLLVEEAVAMAQLEPDDFVSSGVALEEAPYLGGVASDGAGIVQLLDVAQLLSPEVRSALFQTSPVEEDVAAK